MQAPSALVLGVLLATACSSGPRVTYRPSAGAPRLGAAARPPRLGELPPPGGTDLGTIEASGGDYDAPSACEAALVREGQRVGGHVLVRDDRSGRCRARLFLLSASDKPFDAP